MTTRLLLPIALACLTACASGGGGLSATPHAGVNLAGDWSLDYGRSDNLQQRVNVLLRELREQAERRARADMDGRGPVLAASVGGVSDRGEAIIALARMADKVSGSPLLNIEQASERLRIHRENDFTLRCDTGSGSAPLRRDMLGAERCGWDGHQYVHSIQLPEGLSIHYRFTLGPAGDWLHVATSLSSRQVSAPFTVSRVYQRFDPEAAGYHCEQTITRGKVCTTAASP
ncbi:MAG: hypothetical protein CME38_19085 [Haliea sp.]|nr:hypothetical protein [Haliea sp.]